MRERHKFTNFTGKNDAYRPIEVVSGRTERSDLIDGLGSNNNPNIINRLSDVHTQPKFERTYRFTHKKSIVRETLPRFVPEENKHLYTHSYNGAYKNNNNYNGIPTYRDLGAPSGNELKNSLIVNIPDPTTRINAAPNNYQHPQMPRNIPEVYNEDYLYKTLNLKNPIVIKSNSSGYLTALGDLYSGLESLGMAFCKIIAVTGQSCLKACQIIEDYSTSEKEQKRSEKMSPKFGGGSPSITSLCSAPMSLNDRKCTREALDKYLLGDNINLRCKFEVDYDDQDLSSTWVSKSIGQRTNNNKYSENIPKRKESTQMERCNQLNSLKNNLSNGIEPNRHIENKIQSPKHNEIALVEKENLELQQKPQEFTELVLNNPLENKPWLPSFKQLGKVDNSVNRLVDKVENVELSKLNNNMLPLYMDSDKSSKTGSVKTLDNFSNDETNAKKEELAINKLVNEMEEKEKKKGKGKLSKMKLQKNRRC